MKIAVKVDDKLAIAAMQRAPDVMTRHIDGGLSTGAEELAVLAKAKAPKAFSTLVNSIRASRVGDLHYRVSAGNDEEINYAASVEYGTSPGKMPPADALMPWLKQKVFNNPIGLRGPQKRRKYKNSRDERELHNRAFLLARHIKDHGTRAKPFMAPAMDEKEDRIRQLVRASVMEGVREVFA